MMSSPVFGEVRYCPPGMVTPESGYWMTEQDGKDLLAAVRGLEAWNRSLQDALKEERSRADVLMERMDSFLQAVEKEREEWKEFAKKEYRRGFDEGFRRGRAGFGIFVGVNYDGDPVAGFGYSFRF